MGILFENKFNYSVSDSIESKRFFIRSPYSPLSHLIHLFIPFIQSIFHNACVYVCVRVCERERIFAACFVFCMFIGFNTHIECVEIHGFCCFPFCLAYIENFEYN